jgi:hypothetical protein
MPAAWIAEQLWMGHPVRTAALTARDPSNDWGAVWRKARKLMKELEVRFRNIA